MRTRVLVIVLFVFGLAVPRLATAASPGPLKVSPNGRYFVDREGKPFYWLGNQAWPLFSYYSQSEAEEFLRNSAAKGFTVVTSTLVWHVPSNNPPGTVPLLPPFPSLDVPAPNTSGERPWLNNNPATPNDAYFKNVDNLVTFAERQGLMVGMLLTTGYFVKVTKTVNAQNARAYGRWLGNRYKGAPNIIWVNGGAGVPVGFEDVYLGLEQGLREGDGGAHLITYHIGDMHSSSHFYHRADWLAFNMMETGGDWPKIYPMVSADVAMTPPKPTVVSEGAYEDSPEYPLGPITPLIIRRQAWWTALAGGYYVYGHDQTWRMDKGFEKVIEEAPGARQVCLMKEILTAHRWWDMIPDQTLFEDGVSSERTLNVGMRTADSDFAVVYLSSQCRVVLHLDRILNKDVKVTLVNPATGERKEEGTYATGNRIGPFPREQVHEVITPGYWQDAVVLLEGM